MADIPPSKSTDPEDVVWGLQTADTLWKRGERIDALVWLRRAAQSAVDANDDGRAVELKRYASELTTWMTHNSGDPLDSVEVPIEDDVVDVDGEAELLSSVPPGPFPSEAPAPDRIRPRSNTQPLIDPQTQVAFAPPSMDDEDRGSVLPAEQVHAGLFDPWAEAAPPKKAVSEPPVPDVSEPEDEEVITSVRPHGLARSGSEPSSITASSPPVPPKPAIPTKAPAKPPPVPKRPPPLPPKAPLAFAGGGARVPVPATAKTTPSPPIVAAPVRLPTPPPPPPEPTPPPPPPAPEPLADATEAPPPMLNLDDVEAFADLPDDARMAFAAAAQINTLAESDEIGTFALAYVVSGSIDVAATVVDAAAMRLSTGAVLRARGTTTEGVPMRLISAKGESIVATWSDADVDEAFRTIPWVEEDLRAAADRAQTLVGITIGPLGERLDMSIREQIIGRLTMRPLLPGEIVVEAGAPVPGLLLVGVGEIELVVGDKVTALVGSGEFLFPTEVLGAGSAPATARAGSGGALVMFGDRGLAQELLVTCPPLLEVFAGM